MALFIFWSGVITGSIAAILWFLSAYGNDKFNRQTIETGGVSVNKLSQDVAKLIDKHQSANKFNVWAAVFTGLSLICNTAYSFLTMSK